MRASDIWSSTPPLTHDGCQEVPGFTKFPSALGELGLIWSPRGLTHVLLPGAPAPPEPAARPLPAWAQPAAEALLALAGGSRPAPWTAPLDAGSLTLFQREVLAACAELSPGETASYGELARRIGRPGAARAVGGALARNPFPLLIPCHRVLSSTGRLTGFSAPGGLTTKRALLDLEGALP